MIQKKSEIEELKLRSEEVQEILSNPPNWIIRWGMSLLLLFTIILVTLSWIIKYPDFVTAKIIVTTAQPTQQIVSRYSGALERLLVKNGDTVTVGQPLALIRNTAEMKDVLKLKNILDTVSLNTEVFNFPVESTSELILGDIKPFFNDFEKSYYDYQLLNDLDPYSTEIIGRSRSLEEIKQRLEDLLNQKDLLEQEYSLLTDDFNRHEKLFDKGVISQQEFESKRLEVLQKEKEISNLSISISQIREAIVTAGQSLTTTKINKKEDEKKFKASVVMAINSLKKAIVDWEYNYLLISSIDGVIGFQEFWGVNQFINQGEVVFSILPIDTSKLVGKLTLPSQNVGKVSAGQKVLVKLDNYPYQQYGMLVGKVENISISPDKEGNYFVYISLPNGMETSYNKNLKFDQELLGNAEIITENLSVAKRIFFKFRDIFKYDS